MRRIVTPHATEPPRFMPLMRARVVGVDGRRTQLEDADAVRRHGRLTREFGLTFRDTLQSNERVLAGRVLVEPALDGRAARRAGHRSLDRRGSAA